MDKDNLIEFTKITDELNKLLVKFDELNKQTEKIKLELGDSIEAEAALHKLELKYEVLDNKMKDLKEKSDKLKNTIYKK